MNESEDPAKRNSEHIMNVRMNNSKLNNEYSQNLWQTSYESVLSSGLSNQQFMMNDFSNCNLNLINRLNLLNIQGFGMNGNTNMNSSRNENCNKNNMNNNRKSSYQGRG